MRFPLLLAGLAAFAFSSSVLAAPTELTDLDRCSVLNYPTGSAPSVTDVTGNNGGATECYGAFDGTDNVTDGFLIDGQLYSFFAKDNIGGEYEGRTGFVLTCGGVECDGNTGSGEWAFNPTDLLGGSPFLIVLKQQNNPGYAVWQFAGADAASFMGDWTVSWSDGISHASLYYVPLPGTLLLFAIGLFGLRLSRRSA
jgi:hypothetical protein